jgi:hypothetical protein
MESYWKRQKDTGVRSAELHLNCVLQKLAVTLTWTKLAGRRAVS